MPQPGHPDGTLNFGLERAGGGELLGDPITAVDRLDQSGKVWNSPAQLPAGEPLVTARILNSRPSYLVYPESPSPKWQAAAVASHR